MLIIRKARQEDSQFIAPLHTAAVKAIRGDLYSAEEIQAWAVPKDANSYEEAIRSKEFFIAEDGRVIVGFGILNPETAEVEAIYVDPNAGRRGIGLKLLTKLEERARLLGLGELRLNASLNAVPFYERAGFVAHEKSNYRLLSGVEIACVSMSKAVS